MSPAHSVHWRAKLLRFPGFLRYPVAGWLRGDASVIFAILGREPGYEELEKWLTNINGPFFVSPLVKFEASVALARQKAGNIKPPPPISLTPLNDFTST